MLLTLLFIALLGGTYIHPTTPTQEIKQDSYNEFLHTKQAQWNDTTTIRGDNYQAETIIYDISSIDEGTTYSERYLTWVTRQTNHIENQYISADYTTIFFGSMEWRKLNNDITKNGYVSFYQIIEVETFTDNALAYNVETLSTINTNLYGILHQNSQDTNVQLTWDNTQNTSNESLGIYLGTSLNTEGLIATAKTSNDGEEIEDSLTYLQAIGDDYRLRYNVGYEIERNGIETTSNPASSEERKFNKQNFYNKVFIRRNNYHLVNRNTKEDMTDEMWDDPSILNNITWTAQMYTQETMRVNMAVEYIPTEGGEVIDIGGLMFDIIGMPFTFISQAFDVTLFPGTQYQLNIGNLIKGLIAILTVLFIVKLFTKGIDVLGNYTGSIQDASHKREQRQHDRQLKYDAKHGVKEKDIYSKNE